jgi:hypothetical protein
VDWLTATAYRNRKHEEFYETGKMLIEANAKLGNDVSNWKAQGYHGLKCAGVRVGLRHDTFICQLSSDDARESWKTVAALATNVSRLDLQVTYEFEQAQKDFFIEEHKQAVAGKSGRGRKPNVTLITSSLLGDSIYLGQRSSDVYARCYDKGMESKCAPRYKLIRHEIELKRDAAARTVQRLQAAPSESFLTIEMVSNHMALKHLRTASHNSSNRESARARQLPDNDRRLRWLRSAVKPSVAILLQAGRIGDVLECLGLTNSVGELCRTGKLNLEVEGKRDGR